MSATGSHRLGQHSLVVNIVIAGNLAGVVAIFLDNLWEIIIDSIKLQVQFPAPGDSIFQGLAGAAGPEDELVPRLLLSTQVFDSRHIGFAEFRPVAVAKGSIKVHGDDPVVHKIISYSICKIDLIYF